MSTGIDLTIHGDHGPFSRLGKSIGYQITIGTSSYLIDCGAPVFQHLGGDGLKQVKGLILTHCHDDHKRWFTDLALFYRYAPDISRKVFLMTAEDLYGELERSSGPAMDRSLSQDSKNIIDISFHEYIDYQVLGPRARYQIVSKNEENGRYAACLKALAAEF